MSFCKEMRVATRDIHAVSDALVNAKLFFALSNNHVWADGLLVFYEIFRFLEEAMLRHRHERLGQLLVDGMERTESFEKDLKWYLTENWNREYEVRDEVAAYLLYLKKLEGTDSDLLIPYVYHIYLGLLSGGQILTKKRQIKDKIFNRKTKDGYAIVNFGDLKINDLKRSIKDSMEEIASEISSEKRKLMLEESRKVFEWNNRIIKTVKGTNWALLENVFVTISFCLFIYVIFNYIFN